MKRLHRSGHRLFAAWLLPLALLALCRSADAAFEDTGAGARAPGMGNAFTAVCDDAYAVHYNPAGLAQLERPQFSASHARLFMGLSDGSNLYDSTLVYAHPLKAGRLGTLGGAWEKFSLAGKYEESSLLLSYGRYLWQQSTGDRLLAGLSAKYLQRKFDAPPEAQNALRSGQAMNQADPVLAGSKSASAIDADAGFLYSFRRRMRLGLMIRHFLQPDVGFAAQDKLPLDVRLGLGFRSLWLNLTGELQTRKSPSGSMDRLVVFAGERFFPTLSAGQFGVRGSLGLGSRDWKQATLGLSYRINKIQTDYAFLMPISGVSGTAGTHRIALTFHFGAPSKEDELAEDLLRQAERMRQGKEGSYGYEFIDALRPRGLRDPRLAPVAREVDAGRFQKAYQVLLEIVKGLPPDQDFVLLSNRLALAMSFYPDMSDVSEQWEVLTSSGIKNFLYGEDRAALLQTSYALYLSGSQVKLDKFVERLETGVGISALRIPSGHPRGFMDEMFFRVEAANNREDHAQVLRLLEDVLVLSPNDVGALELTGSTYFVLGKYEKALAVLTRVLPLERKADERATIERYIEQCRQKLTAGQGAEPIAAPAAPAKPEAPAAQAKPERPADPAEIERLYQRGVEHYARGENLQASAMFMRILQLDPENKAAKDALARIGRR